MEELESQFQRTVRLLGAQAVDRLRKSRVAVFGIGGVGSFAVEALSRAGVGELLLVDGDVVSLTNLNRQLIALHSTLGLPKAEAAAARVRDINPQARVRAYCLRYGEDTADRIPLEACDYVVDAIDDVRAKLLLIQKATALGVPVISCMGAGNKLDPTAFRVADIFQTSIDPLARVMRRELKKQNIAHLKTVFSTEPPIRPADGGLPASVSFVPSVAGLILAGEVIKDLISE